MIDRLMLAASHHNKYLFIAELIAYLLLPQGYRRVVSLMAHGDMINSAHDIRITILFSALSRADEAYGSRLRFGAWKRAFLSVIPHALMSAGQAWR